MTPVLLDTVGLIAVWDRSDQWHASASAAFDELIKAGVPMATTTFILLECGNAASRRPYRQRVNDLRQRFRDAGRLIDPTPDEIEQAWMNYDRGDGNQAGIVDQISFIVMRRLGMTQAFTNDGHFRAAGLTPLF